MKIDMGGWQIRSFVDSDIGAIEKYANNRNISINLRDRFPFPYTRSDARNWLRVVKDQDVETHFAIAAPDELIGGIGLEPLDDVNRCSAEIGFWLGEPFWGKGIGTKAVHAMTEYGFSDLGLIRIFAYVFDWNKASMRVLEKNGYACEGRLRKSAIKDGKIIDQIVYAITRT